MKFKRQYLLSEYDDLFQHGINFFVDYLIKNKYTTDIYMGEPPQKISGYLNPSQSGFYLTIKFCPFKNVYNYQNSINYKFIDRKVYGKNIIERFSDTLYFEYINKTNFKKTDYEFFSDVYFTEKREKMRTEFVFDNDTAYAFDFCENANGKLRSTIKIGDDSNNPMSVWYIGLDLLFVQRADFDYGKGTVKLFSTKAYHPSSNKLLYLATMVIYSVLVCVAMGFALRSCCAKKKQKDIKKGEELLEL